MTQRRAWKEGEVKVMCLVIESTALINCFGFNRRIEVSVWSVIDTFSYNILP